MRYFLFSRLWPGFSNPFPFDQFNSLGEDVIEGELDLWAKEQYESRLPEIEEIRCKRLAGHRARLEKQSKQRLGSSFRHGPQKSASISHEEYRRRGWGVDTCTTLVQEVGSYLGWFRSLGSFRDYDKRIDDKQEAGYYLGWFVGMGRFRSYIKLTDRKQTVTERYWMLTIDDADLAAKVAQALQEEYAAGKLKLSVPGARFGVIASEKLSGTQIMRANTHIKNVAEQESSVAWLTPFAKKASQFIEDNAPPVANTAPAPSSTETTDPEGGNLAATEGLTDSEQGTAGNGGGRWFQWEKLVKVIAECKAEEPTVTNTAIMATYNRLYWNKRASGDKARGKVWPKCESVAKVAQVAKNHKPKIDA